MSYNLAVLFNRILGDIDVGDLKFWSEIKEEDIVYYKKDNITTIGEKISFTIPEKKILIIDKIILEPTGKNSKSCYANILFADIISGSAYYDYSKDTENAKTDISGKAFHGDNARKLEINVLSISGSFHVRILGFYKDASPHKPYKVVKIQADEMSPDIIKLTFDAPEDNGGYSINGYEIYRSTPDDSNFTLHYSFNNPPEKESNIEYVDGSVASPLADNTKFYYKVKPVTAEGTGEFSEIVSATTEIDHPFVVTNLIATKINPSSVKLTWEAPTDSGGVPTQGYHIQKRSKTKQGDNYTDVTKNTKSQLTFYDVLGLDPDTWEFRIKAINDDGKSSLVWSDTVIILLTYAAPSNIRFELSSDKKSVTVKWDPSSDIPPDAKHGYKIERSLDDSAFAILSSIKDNPRTNYTDSTIDGGTVYFYKIAVLVNDVLGLPGPTIKVIVPNRVASSPQNLNLTVLTHSQIKVAFTHSLDDGGLPRTGHELERSESIGFPDGTGGLRLVFNLYLDPNHT